MHLANNLSVTGYRLTIAYLLVHGFVKVFLVYMLLKRRLWAYPTAIVIFIAFGVYQIYQFTLSHSLLLAGLTVLDAFVIVFTVWEYRILLRRGRTPRRPRPVSRSRLGQAHYSVRSRQSRGGPGLQPGGWLGESSSSGSSRARLST